MSETCIFCAAEWPHDKTPICEDESITTAEVRELTGRIGAPEKSGEDMSNVEATGRKRSVAAKPIKTGMVCEWAFLKEAGGGVAPIAGCPGHPAKHVHHGPDKSVLNNNPETNLSRICTHCHNRWHTANDPFYLLPRPEHGATWLPDPVLANDMVMYDLKFDGPKMTKVEALMLEAERQQEDKRGRI